MCMELSAHVEPGKSPDQWQHGGTGELQLTSVMEQK